MQYSRLLALQAEANLFALSENPYPGRGIVVGLDGTGENLVQAYWIMGRSENSRNRVFGHENNKRLFTEAADRSKLVDPSLIIYNAMQEVMCAGARYAVVSNGHQTDAVVNGLSCYRSPHRSLLKYQYEPDEPNFTPRITAVSYWAETITSLLEPGAEIIILRKAEGEGNKACDRFRYTYAGLRAGFGRCITTYSGDDNPLPAFRGEPYLLPLVGDASQIAACLWGVLNKNNRVSLAVKLIPRTGPSSICILNKYSKVA